MKQSYKPSEKYLDFCYICGFTLPKTDLAADIAGDFVDYNERIRGNITFSICTECWQKLLTNAEGGLEAAIKRSSVFKQELNTT
jgi:hypothetical protein